MYMRTFPVAKVAGVALAISIVMAIFSIVEGLVYRQLGFAIFLFIPVIYGSGLYAFMAVLFIFLSFVFFFILSSYRYVIPPANDRYDTLGGSLSSYPGDVQHPEEQSHGGKKFGGVVFIGPIPIIFGSDRKITGYMIIIAVIMAVLILVSLLIRFP